MARDGTRNQVAPPAHARGVRPHMPVPPPSLKHRSAETKHAEGRPAGANYITRRKVHVLVVMQEMRDVHGVELFGCRRRPGHKPGPAGHS